MTQDTRIFLVAVLISILVHFGCSTLIKTPRYEDDTLVSTIKVTLVQRQEHPVALKPTPREAPKSIPLDIEAVGASTANTRQNELVKKYLFFLREEIEKNKYQPPESRYYQLIGNTRVAFEILPDGSFVHVRTVRSSGDTLLDQTALEAIHATDGTYERPSWSGRQKLNVSFVLKYQYGL